MKYKIVSGDGENRFQLVVRRGIAELHFRKRLKKVGTFDLEIQGHPKRRMKQRGIDVEPFHLNLRLIVTH